jgi:hypothetical protein
MHYGRLSEWVKRDSRPIFCDLVENVSIDKEVKDGQLCESENIDTAYRYLNYLSVSVPIMFI